MQPFPKIVNPDTSFDATANGEKFCSAHASIACK
jgi:hypothetical protein